MQGLVFVGQRRVSLETFPDPTPGPGEAVIRITASGLCGSDLHYYRAAGPTPVIGGHEPAGVVEALGAGVTEVAVGDRVMVSHYAGCGRCPSCRSGWTQMCTGDGLKLTYGKNAHGAHAPYMAVAARSLLPLPEALSFAAGAAIGCGTGTAWGALERLGEVGGTDVVVFGQGPVGLSATMFAAARGARVIAVDLATDRLKQAAEFGAADLIDPRDGDAVTAIRELTGGGARAVVETSGSSAAATTGLAALAPWGRFCVVGLGGTVEIDVRKYLSRQLTVMTSWSLSTVQQLACADFVARRELPVDELFTDRWTLAQGVEAYEDFDRQSGGKAVFTP